MFTRTKLSEIYSCCAMFLLFGGVQYIYSLFSLGSDRSSGNVVFQAISILFYGSAIYFIIKKHHHKMVFFAKNNLPILSLLFLCLLSFTWSIEPSTSIRRSIALFISSIFCLYLAFTFSITKIVFFMWVSICIACFMGVIASFFPGVGTDPSNWQYPDAWRGLTGNKTDFGRISAIGLISSFFLMYVSYIKLKLFILSSVLFLICLFFSDATTPLVLAIAALFCFPLFSYLVSVKSSSKVAQIWFVFILVTAIFSYFAVNNYEPIVNALGKDATFTGRTFIWEYAIMMAEDSPILGSGYRTFWIDKLTFDFHYYNPFWGEELMNNGHNGYIDIYVELGIIGLILFIVFICHYLYGMIAYSNSINAKEQIFGMAILFFFLVYSVTEQIALEQSEFLWMLLTLIYFKANQKNYV